MHFFLFFFSIYFIIFIDEYGIKRDETLFNLLPIMDIFSFS